MIGTMKNTFQLELKNRFTALEEHDDMDSLNQNNYPTKCYEHSKRNQETEKAENSIAYKSSDEKAKINDREQDPRDHIEYVETIKRKRGKISGSTT